MPYILPTSDGDNFFQKFPTEADTNICTAMHLYEMQYGSQGSSSNTVYTLSKYYLVGTNTLIVIRNGVIQALGVDYTETNALTITFASSNADTDVLQFMVAGTYTVEASVLTESINSVDTEQNILINPEFNNNQRAWVSGTNLAAVSDYCVDRWCAGTANSAPTLSGSTLTIPSGDTIKQIVEDVNIPNGDYTLSWEGTAQVSIDGGSAQDSPHTFTVSSGTHVEIEFTPGTVYRPFLKSGENQRAWAKKHESLETMLCRRYYLRFNFGEQYAFYGAGVWSGTTAAWIFLQLPVKMRIAGALEISSAADFRIYYGTSYVTPSAIAGTRADENVFPLLVTASGGTDGNGAMLRGDSGTAHYIAIDAELT